MHAGSPPCTPRARTELDDQPRLPDVGDFDEPALEEA
jgi:hypothetical protein